MKLEYRIKVCDVCNRRVHTEERYYKLQMIINDKPAFKMEDVCSDCIVVMEESQKDAIRIIKSEKEKSQSVKKKGWWSRMVGGR